MCKQSCLKQEKPGRCSIWWRLWQLKWKFSSQSEVITNGQVSVGCNLSASYNTDNSESMIGWSSLRFSKCLHKDAPDVHEEVPSFPSWREIQCEKLESGRGGQCPVHCPFQLSFWINPLPSGHKAHFSSHTPACQTWVYFASEGVVKLMMCTGLGKAALTTWCTTNLLPTGLAWSVMFFLHPAPRWWDGGTGSDFLPQCHPAVPCSDPSHHLPTPGEVFPMITISRVIKERHFSVVFPLLLVKVSHKQGNQVVFTFSGLCSCVFKHWLQNNCLFHTKQAHCGFSAGETQTGFLCLGSGKRQLW